ncbi:hypothetical protein P3L10_030571 [Capsicum annuum]
MLRACWMNNLLESLTNASVNNVAAGTNRTSGTKFNKFELGHTFIGFNFLDATAAGGVASPVMSNVLSD